MALLCRATSTETLRLQWRVRAGWRGKSRARAVSVLELQWNIILGIVGAVIGAWLFPALGLEPFAGFGLMGVIGGAIIGVVIVFLIVGSIRR